MNSHIVAIDDWNVSSKKTYGIRNRKEYLDRLSLVENSLNDKKRTINVLRTDYLGLFLKDFDRIMKYDKSSQYVNKKLKKTENPRIK